jgi:hypothetical protein
MSAPSTRRRAAAASTAVVWAIVAAVAPAAEPEGRRLLKTFCADCHLEGTDEGGVALDHMLGQPGAGGPPGSVEHGRWVAVWKNIRAGTMPPADEPQPSVTERRALLEYVSRDVLGVDPGRPDPGHVVLRRLNRGEYSNTVRDLTGIDENLADDLPADDTGYGFDTIGDVLSLSPLLMEKYMELAARVGDRVAREAAGRTGDEYPGHLQRLFTEGPPPPDDAARADHQRRTLARLAERGFRRPVDDATLDRLVAVAAAAAEEPGGSFEKGVAAAVTAVLASPRFLFRIEEDTAGGDATKPTPIDEFALASRLSYFLWSTMPDDELLRLAREARLRQELPQQVERMVKDRRADALAQNFVGQWLQTRDVEALPFDVRRILGTTTRMEGERTFSDEVRRSMRLETNMLFAHVLREGLPATDLLVGTKTFLNEPLARYYGIPDVKGREMRLVDLPADSHRGGLLAHGSFLVVTSNPTRSSPVKRGMFILDNLLGTPAPPPPGDVPPLEQSEVSLGKEATMRQVMERHRADPLCASCHARMDPLGLALERYDALGRWRGEQAAGTIDTAGRLITGETFADAAELARVIAGPRRRDFHRCLAEKILTYALGRGVEYFDGPAVDTMVEELERDGRLMTLVQGVVASVPFQARRGSPVPPGSPAPKAITAEGQP